MAGPIWSFNKKDPKGSKKNPFTNEGVSISSGFGNPSTPKLATDLGKLHGVDDSWENILDEDALRYNQLKALASVTEKDLKSNTGKSYTLADITGNSADKNVSFKKSAMPSGGQGEGKLELNIEGFKSLTPDDWRESLDDDNPEKKKSTEFMIAQAMITGKGKDKTGELKDRPRIEGEPEVEPEVIPEVAPRGQEEWDNIVGSWAQSLLQANPQMGDALNYIFNTYIDDIVAAWEAGLNPGDAGWPDVTSYPEWSQAQNPNVNIYGGGNFGGGPGAGAGFGNQGFGNAPLGGEQPGVLGGEGVEPKDGGQWSLGNFDPNDNKKNVDSMMDGWQQFAGLPKPTWWPDGAPWPPLIPGTPATTGFDAKPGKPWEFDSKTYNSMSQALNPQHGVASAMEMQRLKLAETRPSTTQSINIPGTNAYVPAIVDGKGNITQMDLPNLESQIDRAIMAGDVNTVRTLMGVRDMPSPVEKLNLAMQIARTPADMFQISRLAGGESMDRFGAMAPFLSQAVQDVFSPTDHLSGLQPMGSRAGMLQSHPQSYQQPYQQQGMGAGTPTQDIRSTLTQGDERFGGGGFAIDPEMEAWKRANAGQPDQVTAPPVSHAFSPNTGPNDVAQSAMANAASGLGYHGLAQQFSGMPRVYGPDPEEEFTTIGQNAHFSGYGGAGGMSPRVGNVMLEGDPIAKPSSLFSTLGLRVPSMQATQSWLPEERIQAEEYVRGLGIDPARLWDEVKIGTPGGGKKPGIRWKESFLD